jgi:hypothetical protein
MMLVGVLLRSLPPPEGHDPLLAGLSRAWSRNIRAGAMALVFLRAGLGLNFSTVKAYGMNFVSFTTLPSVCESLACALVGQALFGMPFLLAWSMSWMTSAVGPGALTSGCASVKERGYSPRAPNFLQTCACFDDAVCIVGFNIALHSFLAGSDFTSSNQWDYKTVLLALIAGLVGGAAAAVCLACTAVWCTPARRSAVLVIACAMLMYVASSWDQIGAGAIANLVMGLFTRHAWRSGWPYPLLSGEHRADPAHAATRMLLGVQRHLGEIWHIAMYPLLFGFLGASWALRDEEGESRGSITKATSYVCIAICVRVLVTAAVTHPMRRFTRRERLYLSLAWCTKSTMQAAFATVPRYLISLWIAAHPPDATLHGRTVEELQQWGEDVHYVCLMSVLISTCVGTIFISSGAYYLLGREAGTGAPGSGSATAAGETGRGRGTEAEDEEADDDTWSNPGSLPELFPSSAKGGSLSGGTVVMDKLLSRGGAGGAEMVAFWALPEAACGPAPAGYMHQAPPPREERRAEAVCEPARCDVELEAAPAADEAPCPEPPPPRPPSPPPPQPLEPPPPQAQSPVAAAAAPLTASLTFTFEGVPEAQEAAVRSALLDAGAAVAELVPGGVQVEVVRQEHPRSTFANEFEDPNLMPADAQVEAGDAEAARQVDAPPPSALRARRWRRAAPCVSPATPSPRTSLTAAPPPPLPLPGEARGVVLARWQTEQP